MPSTIDTKYLRLLRSKPALRTSHHSAILCGSVHAAMGELLPGENSSSQNHSHRKAPWLRRPISMPTSAQRDIKISESAVTEANDIKVSARVDKWMRFEARQYAGLEFRDAPR